MSFGNQGPVRTLNHAEGSGIGFQGVEVVEQECRRPCSKSLECSHDRPPKVQSFCNPLWPLLRWSFSIVILKCGPIRSLHPCRAHSAPFELQRIEPSGTSQPPFSPPHHRRHSSPIISSDVFVFSRSEHAFSAGRRGRLTRV